MLGFFLKSHINMVCALEEKSYKSEEMDCIPLLLVQCLTQGCHKLSLFKTQALGCAGSCHLWVPRAP